MSNAPTTVEIESEPLSWLGPSAPAWLADAVGVALTRTAGGATMSAGLVLRFDESSDLTVETLLSVAGDPRAAKVVAWWNRLPADRREELQVNARMSATQLRLTAEDLEERLDPEDAGWQARLHGALCRRDEIASQCAVLHAADDLDGADLSIEALDEVLRGLLEMLIVPFRCEDSFLEEVASRSPSAWWAEPARA